MNILLDLDGVLADFLTLALAKLNYHFELNLTPSEYRVFNTFNMHEVYKITPKKFWEILEKEDQFWCNEQPFPWAVELINYLYTKGEVTICTSPSLHPVCAKQKVEWCKHYLGMNSSSLMIGGRKHLMARFDAVLIDDYPKNVEAFRAVGGHAILVPSNWNTTDLSYAKVRASIDAQL